MAKLKDTPSYLPKQPLLRHTKCFLLIQGLTAVKEVD